MKRISNINILLVTFLLTGVLTQETTRFLDSNTFKVTLQDVFEILNDTATTTTVTPLLFNYGQRLTTKFPNTFTIKRRTTTESIATSNLFEPDRQQITEQVTLSPETDKNLTPASVAAVYEDETKTSEMDHRESVTTSHFTKHPGEYPEIPSLMVGNGWNHASVCDFCLYEGEGNFTSYGYPLRYRNNLNCTYRIQRIDQDETCEVELYFHDFDVPISSLPSTLFQSLKNNLRENDCKEDYLEVGGRRFCGIGWKHRSEVIPFPKEQRELIFKFVSKSKKSGRGFWVEVKRRLGTCYGIRLPSKASKTCEERFSEVDFYLKSTHFPDNYPNNEDCAYFIRRANNDVCGLEMTFHKFDVELSDGCQFDYLEIDGQKLCGTLPVNVQKFFPFETDQKLLIFQSDGQNSGQGFDIHIRQLFDCDGSSPSLPAPPTCNVCTSEGAGTLLSYGYPENYRNNLLCTFTIDRRNADYCQVELDFQDFELDDNNNCMADYLQVEGKRYCGSSLKSTKRLVAFDNRDKSVVLVFKTDSLRTKKGFLIQYKQIECSSNDLIPDKATSLGSAVRPDATYHHCDYFYSHREFYLQSENYTYNYPNNLDCNYYIKRNNSKVCYIELNFIKFDVEASPECQYDFLEVGNTVRLCGSLQEEAVRVYNFDGLEKVIKFHSDASTNRGGFLIRVEQLECQGDKIIRRLSTPATPVPAIATSAQTTPIDDRQCNQEYHVQELTINSPGYPKSYGPAQECTYIIKKLYPSVCRIDVTFYDFEVQSSDPSGFCKYDYLDFNGIRVCGEIIKGTVRNYYFSSDTFVIRFYSDKSVTSSDRGFRIAVRQSECEANHIEDDTRTSLAPTRKAPLTCDRIQTNTVFELKSLNYPENYPNEIYCKYTILKKSDLNICQLEVNFIDMSLEADNGCQKDYIEFNGQVMCGSLPSETTRYYPFDGKEFIINFSTDSYITNRGFFLRIRQRECPFEPTTLYPPKKPTSNAVVPCGGTFSETSFELQTPHYPGNYDDNSECIYLIKRKNEKICRIELRFIDFDVDASTNCKEDFLMIDGTRYCGHYKVNHIKMFPFYEYEKILFFKSDSSKHKRGFLIKAQQKECEVLPVKTQTQVEPVIVPSLPSVCELCFTEVIGTMQSYDYPNNYPPNLNCKYKITALPNHCMVQLKFDEFNLEPASYEGCVSDYLEINNVKYCGRQLEGAARVLTFYGHQRDVTIRFVTNSKVSSRGFRASYSQLPCPEDHKPQPDPQSRHPGNGIASSGSYPITVLDKHNSINRIPCDLVIYDMKFEIFSPNYPGTAPVNSDCLFSIRRLNPNICKLKLQFVHFKVDEKPDDCTGDYLEVVGKRLCGQIPNDTMREFEFTDYKTSLRFRSDSSNYYDTKFMIRGEQIDCTYEMPPRIYSPYDQPIKGISRKMGPTNPFVGSFMHPTKSFEEKVEQDYGPEVASSSKSKIDLYQQSGQPISSSLMQTPYSSMQPSGFDSIRHPMGSFSKSSFNRPILIPESMPIMFKDQMSKVNYDDQKYSREESVYNKQMASPYSSEFQKTSAYSYDHSSEKCDQQISNMFFEIKNQNSRSFECMYTIKKMKNSICQLDLMFESFNLGDPSCQREYLNADGERLCGMIPKDAIRTYNFNQPSFQIFIKTESFNGMQMSIKGRQVECRDHQISAMDRFKPKPYGQKPETAPMTGQYSNDSQINAQIRVNNPQKVDFPGGYKVNGYFPGPPRTGLIGGESAYGQSDKHMIRRTNYPQSQSKTSNDYSGKYCDQTIGSMKATITSPNFPTEYGNNLYCKYAIRQADPNVCAVDLKFDYFDIEDDSTCGKDYLEIDSGRVCGRLPSSHERRYYFLPNEDEKSLIFNSDSAGSGSGFSIQIQQITDCSKPWRPADPAPPVVCDVCSHSPRGRITSSNYPKNYGDFTKCSFRIQAMGTDFCQVKIFIRDIDIEPSQTGNCDKDSLVIGGERLCGQDPKVKEMTLNFPLNEPREIQFNFQSDGSGTGRGFYLEYVQERCSSSGRSPSLLPAEITITSQSSESSSRDKHPEESFRKPSNMIPPIYPPNYVSRAHIEEIVQTQVQVLDKRNDTLPGTSSISGVGSSF